MDTQTNAQTLLTSASVAGSAVTTTAYHASQMDANTLALYVTIGSGLMTGTLAFIGIIVWIAKLLKK